MNTFRPLTLVLALLTCAPLLHAEMPGKTQHLDSPDQTPQGLAKSDWASIRAAYEAGRHEFKPIEGGWQARNPGQHWTTKFDGRGFIATPREGDWTWGLELESYGRGAEQRTVNGQPAVKAEGQKLSYEWDATVQEWWVNDQRGLEHGYTLAQRPGTKDPSDPSVLSLLIATRGTLTPKVTPGALGVSFCDAGGATVLNYAGLKVWDADGKVLASRFESAGAGRVRLVVEESAARYPITIDPVAQQAYVKPAAVGTTQAGDQFGISVSVSGDTVVVGANFEDSSTTGINSTPDELATNAGAAYVFVRSGTTWSQQAYLKASQVNANDNFGISVAVSGDTVVVGAPFEDSSTTGINSTPDELASAAGAAYVFVRSGTTWSQQAYLKASQVTANDQFGWSVAVSGDTVVVGAPFEDSSTTGINSTPDELASAAGAAYVFVRSGTDWSQQAYLKASQVTTGDQFGISVAVSGDTVVVGANLEDSSTTGINSTPDELASAAGAAYVFVRSGTDWSQQVYLKASQVTTGDQFGISVAVSGDTVVVGANLEDSSTTGINSTPDELASAAGAAYVFVRSGTTWSQQAYLKASQVTANDGFGTSVAVSGDTVVVGATGEDSSTTGITSTPNESATNAGAAYMFVRSGTTWSQQAYLKASQVTAQDQFGISVAVSGDTVVVGAINEDSSTTGINSTPNELASAAGAAYIFRLPNPALTLERPVGTLLPDNVTADLGSVATGASGTAQTFTVRNSGTSDLTGLTLTVNGGNAGDFALSAPSSTTVLAGGTVTFTVTFTPGAPDFRTCALHYSVSGDAVTHDLRLTGTGLGTALINAVQQAYAKPGTVGTTQAGDQFGYSVAVSGDTVVIGVPFEDSSTTGINSTPDELANSAGAAYVFVRSGTTWSQQAYLKASQVNAFDQFGYSVAVSGDTVVVGAPFEDSITTGINSTPNESASAAGAAYVFVRSGTTWSQQAYLKASQVTASDNFGYSVAVSGDTVVVGAPFEDSSTTGINSTPNEFASAAGAAYVFVRSGTDWSQQAYLKASQVTLGDQFGWSVAVSGDTVVVGANVEDSSTTGINSTPNELASDAGAACVFVRSGTTWSQQAYLKASQVTVNDQFGYSVAVSGDTVVVGAPFEDSSTTGINSTANESATDAGAAYVFVRSGTTWSQQAYLKASQVTASDRFGISVAVSGDTVVVGAYLEDSSTTGIDSTPNETLGANGNAGAAYVFVRSGTTWSQQAYLKASQVNAGDFFGCSVAVSGDTVVVGAYSEDSSTTGINSTPNELAANAGAAYFFTSSYAATVSTPTSASVTSSTATLGGNVSADGGGTITERGVVYSITTANANPLISGTGVTKVTASGTTGVFTSGVTGLSAHTGYTYKAYAINAAGTSYTSADTFTTLNTLPTAPAGSTTGTTGDQQTYTVSFPATDADGDAVSITSAASGTSVSVDSFTGTSVTFTPGSSFTGSGDFTYTVSDGIGTATGTITVTVTDNDAPVVAAHANVTVDATSASGATVTYADGSASDNVGVASLTYSQNSGTTFPIGTTTVTISATDAANNTGTGTFTVTVLSVQQTWRQLYFGTTSNTGNAADNADWDSDGVTNLAEFGFGTLPDNNSSGPSVIEVTGGVIARRGAPTVNIVKSGTSFTYNALFGRRKDWAAAGLTFTVQFSGDLGTWYNSTATPTVIADDGTVEAVTVRYPFFVGGKKAQLFRVVVGTTP